MNWMRESPASRNLESFLIARVLASPGETFDEEVAVSEKADEKPFNHGFLTKDCLGDVCFERTVSRAGKVISVSSDCNVRRRRWSGHRSIHWRVFTDILCDGAW